MVVARGVNEDQGAVGCWVLKHETKDSHFSVSQRIIHGGDGFSSGNVDELPEQSEYILNQRIRRRELTWLFLLQSVPINSRLC